MLVALRHIQTIEPCFFSGIALRCILSRCIIKEKDIGGYRRVRREYTCRQTYNGMQIIFCNQTFLDSKLRTISTKQKSIRQNDTCTTILCKSLHNQHHKEVCCFTTSVFLLKILNSSCISRTSKRGIHSDGVQLSILLVITHGVTQRIHVMYHWFFDTMKQNVGYSQQVREWLPLLTHHRVLKFHFVLSCLALLLQMLQGRHNETASTTGKVAHLFA